MTKSIIAVLQLHIKLKNQHLKLHNSIHNKISNLSIMSLSSILPAPTNQIWDREDEMKMIAKGAPSLGALVSAKVAAPPYGQRKGINYI